MTTRELLILVESELATLSPYLSGRFKTNIDTLRRDVSEHLKQLPKPERSSERGGQ